MEKQPGDLLMTLDNEIEKKCFELKQKRTEKYLKRFFIIACAMFLIIPFLLIFAGVNLVAVCLPSVLFLAASLGILAPIISGISFGGFTK